MGPNAKLRALYSDESENYRFPIEVKAGDNVHIRFRTARDGAQSVCFVTGDGSVPMNKSESDALFDYYSIDIVAGEVPIKYWFEITVDGEVFNYNRHGMGGERNARYSFTIVPGFSTPDWAKGAVMYQIYTDRFCNGDPSNDVEDREYYYLKGYVENVSNWSEDPRTMDVRSFYGGDLQGIWDKLDYLQDLGVQVLYLNPIFVSPSNHKYDIQDYDHIDPHFGVIVKDEGKCLTPGDTDNRHAEKYIQRVTDMENLEASNQFFIKFVEEIHRRGMKIILDGVFNHCGSFNKWMDQEKIYEGQPGYDPGAYTSQDSPYHSFFTFTENDWPDNSHFESWWNQPTLPKLNYTEGGLLEEDILRIGRKWVSAPYNVDGWRLDVAADLGKSPEYNHAFWKKFRKAVKEANPNALILAEHYGDASKWLAGDEWDSVMNYDAFMDPVTYFFTGMEKHSDQYREDLIGNVSCMEGALEHHMCSFYYPSLLVAMNELSNHDHSRFLTRTTAVVGRLNTRGPRMAEQNTRKGVLKEAVVFQMTWPGAPTVYYGDEAGVCGFTDPDSRRTYPWGHEDHDLIAFHKAAIALHRKYRTMTFGSLKYLTMRQNILSYGRFDKDEKFVIVMNNSDETKDISVPVWEIGVTDGMRMETVLRSWSDGFSTQPVYFTASDGQITVTMGKEEAFVLRAV